MPTFQVAIFLVLALKNAATASEDPTVQLQEELQELKDKVTEIVSCLTPTTKAAGSGDPIPTVQLQEELQELKDKVTKMETDGSTTATAFDCHLSQVGEKWIGTGATVVFNKCDGRQKFNTLSR